MRSIRCSLEFSTSWAMCEKLDHKAFDDIVDSGLRQNDKNLIPA
jgi:hypothetical protein